METPISTGDLDLRRIAELPSSELVSEEDVKYKVVLPILRALGYEEPDFNFERRTGKGYVDVVLERFPIGMSDSNFVPESQRVLLRPKIAQQPRTSSDCCKNVEHFPVSPPYRVSGSTSSSSVTLMG